MAFSYGIYWCENEVNPFVGMKVMLPRTMKLPPGLSWQMSALKNSVSYWVLHRNVTINDWFRFARGPPLWEMSFFIQRHTFFDWQHENLHFWGDLLGVLSSPFKKAFEAVDKQFQHPWTFLIAPMCLIVKIRLAYVVKSIRNCNFKYLPKTLQRTLRCSWRPVPTSPKLETAIILMQHSKVSSFNIYFVKTKK